jgi:two-component system chemotaxis sensor kinase CheA
VSLQLPLTLAIIRGFVVGVADERYVIPLESVVECVPLPGNEPSERKHGVLELRGRPLPYLRLREVFGLGGSPGERGTVVVVEQEGKQAGLAVDLVLGEAQSVIKPVSKVFGRMAGVAGSSILGTGRVALILDVPGLMRAALRRAAAPAA